jgi:lactoylglutathione lyase
MRTLHFGLYVADLDRSLAFYSALGYRVVGEVADTPLGHLSMLKLPADEFVTIELVHSPTGEHRGAGGGLSHFVIQVDSMASALHALAASGVEAEPPTSPDGSDDFITSWVTDPDDNRIELVEWPAGHPEGMTAADFPG